MNEDFEMDMFELGMLVYLIKRNHPEMGYDEVEAEARKQFKEARDFDFPDTQETLFDPRCNQKKPDNQNK